MSWRRFNQPAPPALGMIELSSIARGVHTTDAMLKVAQVQLIMARSICSGKFMVMVAGELSEVEASVAAGLEIAAENAIDHILLPNVHPDVYPAVASNTPLQRGGALGILESFSVASLIEAIDRVAKTADVQVAQCRLAMALGGKAYLAFSGDVEAVRYSLDAGSAVIEERGLLVNKVVIPDPHPEIYEAVIG